MQYSEMSNAALEAAIRGMQNELDRRARMDDEFQGLADLEFEEDRGDATQKQRMLITKLLGEKDLTGTNYAGHTECPYIIRKHQASAAITELLALPHISARAASRPELKKDPAPEGVYIKDDQVYKVKIAVHGSGRPYAQRLDPETGSWDIAPGMVFKLTEGDKLTPEKAAAWGRLYGICAVCGRTLTNEESISAGIGPVCAGRL